MFYKFISSEIIEDENKGVSSIVKISTKDGNFIGVANLKSGDFKSKFIGCEIAETKAVRKAIKRRILLLSAEKKSLNDLLNTLSGCKWYVNRSRYGKTLENQINTINNNIISWKKQLAKISETIIKLSKK